MNIEKNINCTSKIKNSMSSITDYQHIRAGAVKLDRQK